LRVPIIVAWAKAGFAWPEPVAGGFGNRLRVPIIVAWAKAGFACRSPSREGLGTL
jgi:hypothetical protein